MPSVRPFNAPRPSSLSNLLTPADQSTLNKGYYITFANDDGCKNPDKQVSASLNSLPGTSSSRAETANPDIDLTVEENESEMVDLNALESIATKLLQKRLELELTQAEVAHSMRTLYGLNRSSGHISRLERLELGVGHALSMYPIVVKWLKDASDPKVRPAILQAGRFTSVPTSVTSLDQLPPSVREHLKSRKVVPVLLTKTYTKRQRIPFEVQKKLEAKFREHKYLRIFEFRQVGNDLDLDPKVVRDWFAQRRRKLRRTKKFGSGLTNTGWPAMRRGQRKSVTGSGV